MSTQERLKEIAISLPTRNDLLCEYMVMNENGGRFDDDVISPRFFKDVLTTKSVSFRFVWFKGVKFILLSDRDQSKEKWKSRAFITYGQDPSQGRLIYGNLLVMGWDERASRIRSLTELEKDLLWECVKCLTVNYGTRDRPDIEVVFRLCGAEDHPTGETPFIIEGDVPELMGPV